jgi:hypothetical protein
MTFLDTAVFSFAPALAAIIAAALILPRAWLAFYAAFVIAALAIYSDLSGRYDDAAFEGLFSALFCLLAFAALAAGLATRWALKARPLE